MPSTSGNYTFQSVETEVLIREAFERIGISGEYVEGQKLESARRIINILLLDWMTKSENLWTLRETYIGLVTGQRQYFLDPTYINITQVNLRTSSRQLSGVAQTNTTDTYDANGGGNADDAFDGNLTTSCLQTSNNGNISYDYGINNTSYITFVGFIVAAEATYELLIESCPLDPTVLNSWAQILHLPAQTYKAGTPYFFDIKTPVNARAYRLRGINNNSPLNMTEIYFNNNTFDVNIPEISRYTYNTYPNKFLIGRPSVFYLDRQIIPVLYIWPTPSTYYNCIAVSYRQMMQDTNLYYETVDLPAKMYPALIWGISWHLAIKYKPDMAEMLEAKYQQAFAIATREDSESIPISIKRY